MPDHDPTRTPSARLSGHRLNGAAFEAEVFGHARRERIEHVGRMNAALSGEKGAKALAFFGWCHGVVLISVECRGACSAKWREPQLISSIDEFICIRHVPKFPPLCPCWCNGYGVALSRFRCNQLSSRFRASRSSRSVTSYNRSLKAPWLGPNGSRPDCQCWIVSRLILSAAASPA